MYNSPRVIKNNNIFTTAVVCIVDLCLTHRQSKDAGGLFFFIESNTILHTCMSTRFLDWIACRQQMEKVQPDTQTCIHTVFARYKLVHFIEHRNNYTTCTFTRDSLTYSRNVNTVHYYLRIVDPMYRERLISWLPRICSHELLELSVIRRDCLA